MAERRRIGGPGRAGGLLFLAILLLISYLLVAAVAGVLRLLLGLALLIVLFLFARSVLRRR